MEHHPRRRFGRQDAPPDDELLSIAVELDRGRAWVRVTGELDMSDVTRLREALRDVERQLPHTIVLDLRALDFIDSSGLSELLIARRRGERVGRRVLLSTSPDTATANVLAMTGIDSVMENVDGPPGDRDW
jgi:anti-sigma B factor antagonist